MNYIYFKLYLNIYNAKSDNLINYFFHIKVEKDYNLLTQLTVLK